MPKIGFPMTHLHNGNISMSSRNLYFQLTEVGVSLRTGQSVQLLAHPMPLPRPDCAAASVHHHKTEENIVKVRVVLT